MLQMNASGQSDEAELGHLWDSQVHDIKFCPPPPEKEPSTHRGKREEGAATRKFHTQIEKADKCRHFPFCSHP